MRTCATFTLAVALACPLVFAAENKTQQTPKPKIHRKMPSEQPYQIASLLSRQSASAPSQKHARLPLLERYFFGLGGGAVVGSAFEQDALTPFPLLTAGYTFVGSPWMLLADIHNAKFTGTNNDTRNITSFNPSLGYRLIGSLNCCDIYFHGGLSFSTTQYRSATFDKTTGGLRLQVGTGIMGNLSNKSNRESSMLWRVGLQVQQSPSVNLDETQDILDYLVHVSIVYTFGSRVEPKPSAPSSALVPIGISMRSVRPADDKYVAKLKTDATKAVTVYFDKELAVLTTPAISRLNRFFAELLRNRFIKDSNIAGVVIVGYTDKTHVVGGKVGEQYNLNLAKQRALATSQYLVKKGLPQVLIKHFWVGQKHLKVNFDDSDDFNLVNRRVEVYVVKK